MSSNFTLKQDIYPQHKLVVDVTVWHENDLTEEYLNRFLKSIEGDVVGVYATYGPSCTLSKLAFASLSSVLVVTFKPGATNVRKALSTRRLIQNSILASSIIAKFGANVDLVSFSLFHDLNLRVDQMFNISDDLSLESFHSALGGDALANKAAVSSVYFSMSRRTQTHEDIALHAWAIAKGSSLPEVRQQNRQTLPMNSLDMNTQVRVSTALIKSTSLIHFP